MILIKLFVEQQWRHRHREQTYGHRRWERKERMGLLETVTWKLTLPYVK